MILGVYRIAAIIGNPVIRGLLARRRARGKEDAVRFRERQGVASMARPTGPVTWIHAASVGESISILSLVERIHAERPDLTLLVTTGTVTSAAIMADRLPRGVLHQYAPVDLPGWVRRFLDHWRPDLVLWVESEFWPTLLTAIASRKIPLVLINARVSQQSFKGWQRVRGTIGTLMQCFSLCLAQSEDDGKKLTALGARDVRVPGNLKFTAAPLPVDDDPLADISDQIGDRPVWAAVSTHEGEETIIAEAHRKIAENNDAVLTIIAPRHPIRGETVAHELSDAGYRIVRRSSGEAVTPDTQIYIVDSVGELGLVYRLAKIAFIGGSLIPHGGQNLLEAAKLGCAILHGPSMFNFKAIVDEMQQSGATEMAIDAVGIARAVTALLRDDGLRQTRTRAASDVAQRK
ncbi:MAG: 3-deoxy-D-manno-octulosonic acid transferase, partial [Rhodospirillaceae bacterium]|nr:3-deoxy-D-manno-octulosonic acid transferase [Rhodospirillaceae bacterium]